MGGPRFNPVTFDKALLAQTKTDLDDLEIEDLVELRASLEVPQSGCSCSANRMRRVPDMAIYVHKIAQHYSGLPEYKTYLNSCVPKAAMCCAQFYVRSVKHIFNPRMLALQDLGWLDGEGRLKIPATYLTAHNPNPSLVSSTEPSIRPAASVAGSVRPPPPASVAGSDMSGLTSVSRATKLLPLSRRPVRPPPPHIPPTTIAPGSVRPPPPVSIADNNNGSPHNLTIEEMFHGQPPPTAGRLPHLVLPAIGTPTFQGGNLKPSLKVPDKPKHSGSILDRPRPKTKSSKARSDIEELHEEFDPLAYATFDQPVTPKAPSSAYKTKPVTKTPQISLNIPNASLGLAGPSGTASKAPSVAAPKAPKATPAPKAKTVKPLKDTDTHGPTSAEWAAFDQKLRTNAHIEVEGFLFKKERHEVVKAELRLDMAAPNACCSHPNAHNKVPRMAALVRRTISQVVPHLWFHPGLEAMSRKATACCPLGYVNAAKKILGTSA